MIFPVTRNPEYPPGIFLRFKNLHHCTCAPPKNEVKNRLMKTYLLVTGLETISRYALRPSFLGENFEHTRARVQGEKRRDV